MTETRAHNASCACGAAAFDVDGAPLLRAFCHCEICQAFNQAPFGDITLYRARDVGPPSDEVVEYRSWQPPGLVLRGQCRSCGKPALEKLRLPGLPKILIVPTANLRDQAQVPGASLHMFYHRRVAEVDDALPKYSGFLGSQLGFSRHLLPALWRR